LSPLLLKTVQNLFDHGVHAVTGACGFMALFQKEVAEKLKLPVFDFFTMKNYVYTILVRKAFNGLL